MASGSDGSDKNTSMNDLLANDILKEILHRIPSKSAVQCKTVCKRWCSLIPSPYFLSRFYAHQLADPCHQQNTFIFNCYMKHLFLIPSQDPPFQFSLKFLPPFNGKDKSKLRIVEGSCNGLLLCTIDHIKYYICNPFTKQWVALPPPLREHHFVNVAFICDPYYQLNNKKRGFKVIRIPYIRLYKSEFEIEIFSSETGQWTDAVMSSPKPFHWEFWPTPAIAYNGWLHWLTAHKEIVVYDIHNNRVPYLIDPPEGSPHPRSLLQCLGVCCGKLMICLMYLKNLTIWELDHNNHQEKPKWNLTFQVYLPWLTNSGQLIAIHPDNPKILYLSMPGNIVVCCNLETKTSKSAIGCPSPIGDHFDHFHGDWTWTFTLIFPSWPTPIPSIQWFACLFYLL